MSELWGTELWSTERVALHLGLSTNSADRALRRAGVRPVAREPGRGGKNLYDADVVRAALASRPGQGRRTDLAPIGLEARCASCDETFNPADEADLVHLERSDGRPCGGRGRLVGEWS